MKLKTIILSFFIIFLANGALAASDYYYELIDVDITINSDSTFDIIETQTYNLNGNFGFFYRDIALKRLDHISNIEVFDGNNNKLPKDQYSISYEGDVIRVQWDFQRRYFRNEEKSWVVKYKVHGGLGFYDDYDEVYWNAIFKDREVPVKNAEVLIRLPDQFEKESINTWLYKDYSGGKNLSNNYEIKDNQVRFWENDILAGQSLTIVVTWPKGFVSKPFLYRNQLVSIIVLIATLLIPILSFFYWYRKWKKSGKDEKITKTIIAQYEQPDNISPALMGVLINQKVSIKEILATVIDLAVRGYIRIKEEENKISFFKNKQYTFEKLKEPEGLKLYERKIMESIFKNKTLVSSSELKNKFYKHIPTIEKAIYSQTDDESDYFNGDISKIRKKNGFKNFMVIAGAIVFGFIFSFLVGGNIVPLAYYADAIFANSIILSLSLALAGIIGIAFSYYMPALTLSGAEAKWKALGFKEYLRVAERFRIGAETLETFSMFLPYAMVFGVEKQWVQRFASFSFKNQSWYIPAGSYTASSQGFSMANFSSSFSSFTDSISSAFYSSPGGSGAGGAGGAGGGGGGGGGGAG